MPRREDFVMAILTEIINWLRSLAWIGFTFMLIACIVMNRYTIYGLGFMIIAALIGTICTMYLASDTCANCGYNLKDEGPRNEINFCPCCGHKTKLIVHKK